MKKLILSTFLIISALSIALADESTATIIDADGRVSVSASHNVIQEYSYCGRGNENEPLTKVMFWRENIHQTTPEQLCRYSVTLTPMFRSLGGVNEIRRLHAWVRIFPQVSYKDGVAVGNPLRGDQYNAKPFGEVPPEQTIDLGIFDYRSPMLATNQTVFDLGALNNGNTVVSGQEYTVYISPKVAQKIIDEFKRVRNNLVNNGHLEYYDPRFYIYITADINPDAKDFDMATKTRNSIGGIVTKVTTPENQAGFFGDDLISTALIFDDEGVYTDKTTTLDRNYYKKTYQFKLHTQEQYTRTILKARKLMYAPYDGYSKYYRIPGLSDLADGTLVLTADARKDHNHDTPNNFDVISRLSTDNGMTWTEAHTLVDGYYEEAEGNCDKAMGFGDAAVVDLPTPGNVIAVFISGAGVTSANTNPDGPKIMYSISTTSGRSWGEPKRIPTDVYSYDPQYSTDDDKNATVACPGPGRMCQVKEGHLKGKILLCAYEWQAGNNTKQPLSILAYDEETDTWSNVGHLGKLGACVAGESQIVEIAPDRFILTMRNEGKAVTRRWWYLDLMEETDAAGHGTGNWVFHSWDKDHSGWPQYGWDYGRILELKEGTNPFGTGAGECNSNFFVYNNNGTKYLVQASPTTKLSRVGLFTGTLQPRDGRRSSLKVKMANIDQLTTMTKKQNFTNIDWNEGFDFTVFDSDGVPMASRTTGYSCVSPLANGDIAVASEEYEVPYMTARDCAKKSDLLMSIWYNAVSIESISMGEIEKYDTHRHLARPDMDPYNSTFKVNPLVVENPDFPGHEGIFEPESAKKLPNIKITVDPDQVVVLPGEKWRIEYEIYYRLHNSTTGVLLTQGWSDYYTPDAVNADGLMMHTVALPMDHETFLSEVVPLLEAALSEGVTPTNENARTRGFIHADDSFVVRTRVSAYPEESTSEATFADALESGLINTTGYYAVSPARKVKIKLMPEGIESQVQMSTAYATALFNNHSNLAGRPNSEIWLFCRPGYPVTLQSIIPDDSPADFLGFTIAPTNPADDMGNYNPSSPLLMKNLDDVQVHQYPNPLQMRFWVPDTDTYPGDAEDYDCLTIYAWFKSYGGIYSEVIYDVPYLDIYDDKNSELRSRAGWISDETYHPEDEDFDTFLAGKPDPMQNRIAYPQTTYNVPHMFSNGEHLSIFKHAENGFDDGFFDLTIVPDQWGHNQAAVVTLWTRDSKGIYHHAIANGRWHYSYAEDKYEFNENTETKRYNIDGHKYSDWEYSWCSPNGLPEEQMLRISTHGVFDADNVQPNAEIGLLLIAITSDNVEDDDADLYIELEEEFLNNLSAPSSAKMKAPSTSNLRKAAAQESLPVTLYRVAYPIHYDGSVITGLDNVSVDAEAPAEYFDLMGRRIQHPAPGQVIIERRGATSRKILTAF